LFANCLSIVREKAASRRIHLELTVIEPSGWIRADARKVRQILDNLLSNAVKFTAEGGRVTLAASVVPRAQVGRLTGPWPGRCVPLGDSGFADFLEISVTDSGIGIGTAGLERLFLPFSQVDGGPARRFEGTGLGLALIKVLVELHGGALAVESAVGEGSRFTVWLPLRLADEAASAAVDAPEEQLAAIGPPGPRTALVVEDDPKSAELIRVQLEAEGFRVLHAASTEAALLLAAEEPLSLIALDIMLPGVDGWEFLTRAKQLRDLQRIPVVIVSIAADRRKGFSLGAASVMQKPISRQELYATLVDLGLSPRASGQALKVLIVDDDPTAVELVAMRITGLAGTILRAYSGGDAIAAARRELPDLIVLDLMMPGVSGFDVVQALKDDVDTSAIPILVVTGRTMTAADRTGLTGQVAAVMEKGDFDRDHFTAEVRRAMSGRAAG
jgi:DNA-binding response OmpR family regulator